MSSNSLIYINGVLQDPKTYRFKGQGMSNQSLQTMLNTVNNTGFSNISPGLSFNQLNSLKAVTIDIGNFNRHPEVKKYEVFESPEDLIVLSATWQRIRAEKTPNSVSKLLDNELFKYIEQQDRERATTIRDYYSKKIMMWNLKNIKLSNFRQDLNKLIHSDGCTFKENTQGLAYRLPYFYDYDIEMDDIRMTVDYKTALKLPRVFKTIKFEPLKKLNPNGKGLGMYEYWLKGTDTNCPFSLKIDKQNPLLHIWDHLFSNQKVLILEANCRPTSRDDFEYFSIEKWSLSQA